jgi:hypothetical protein
MNKKLLCQCLLGVIVLVLTNTTYADKRVNKDKLEKLISGNTLEGKWFRWETNYRMYLDPSGDFIRVYGDEFGSSETGRWFINKKDKLCFEIANTACRRVKQRGDGGYNLYGAKKVLKQTIEKITEGNHYKLE